MMCINILKIDTFAYHWQQWYVGIWNDEKSVTQKQRSRNVKSIIIWVNPLSQ